MTLSPELLARLLDALPPHGHEEVILRGTGSDATATLRYADAAPRVFGVTPAGTRELLPAEDTRLPGHALLADRATLAAAVEPHIGALHESRLVAWRPGRRAVVRLTARNGTTWWLKLLDARGHRRASRLFADLGPALPPARLCRPTCMLPEHGAHLAPQAEGVALRTLLHAGSLPALPTLCRSLLAIGCTDAPVDLPRIDFGSARDAAVGMLAKAGGTAPALLALRDRVAALALMPMTGPLAFVHGDLHDKQIFVHANGADVIDLEGAGIGDARVDLTNLAEHLRLRDLQQGGEDSGLGDHLLARCGIDPDCDTTRAFRIVVRARLCGVYAQRPRWAALTSRLVHELDLLLPPQP